MGRASDVVDARTLEWFKAEQKTGAQLSTGPSFFSVSATSKADVISALDRLTGPAGWKFNVKSQSAWLDNFTKEAAEGVASRLNGMNLAGSGKIAVAKEANKETYVVMCKAIDFQLVIEKAGSFAASQAAAAEADPELTKLFTDFTMHS